ncbi:caspase-13-like [Dasypus novemcinctus]|uniref:caspase-13-like n=1 Tax=Dasypus novemcinctus TaxID=9361 RepID=UPI00265F66E3|nr:caspase-13-like [Dasypus novemcinctus]
MKSYPIQEKVGCTHQAPLICNTECDHLPRRSGADHDIIGMQSLLERLGYGMDVQQKLRARDREENPDVLPYDTIFQVFNNQQCPYLKDKSKVIILHACRGENSGAVWVTGSPAASAHSSSWSPENLMDDGIHKAHLEKDFVAFCSSTSYNVSWSSTKGSIFVTRLMYYFRKYSWCCSLLEIFSMVQRSFENPGVKPQIPTIERPSLPRPFYLFPGN